MSRVVEVDEAMQRLSALSLRHSRVEGLSPLFLSMTRLLSLDLSLNPLVPTSLSLLPLSLRELNLSQCGLTALPAEFSRLRSLHVLRLSHNPLSLFPPSLSALPELERLTLFRCGLRSLPDPATMLSRTRLSWLDLSGNPVQVRSARPFAAAFPNACVDVSVPDEVLEGRLFISDEESARNVDCLSSSLQVTHVLSVCHFRDALPFVHRVIEIDDALDVDIAAHFDETFEFIDTAPVVLVHCSAGVSRSSSICIAYLMKKRSISYQEAFGIVVAARPCVAPNDAFKEQLLAYERKILGGK